MFYLYRYQEQSLYTLVVDSTENFKATRKSVFIPLGLFNSYAYDTNGFFLRLHMLIMIAVKLVLFKSCCSAGINQPICQLSFFFSYLSKAKVLSFSSLSTYAFLFLRIFFVYRNLTLLNIIMFTHEHTENFKD